MDLLDRIRFWSSLALALLLFVWAAFWFAVGVLHLWQGALASAGLPLGIAGIFAGVSWFFWRWGEAARR